MGDRNPQPPPALDPGKVHAITQIVQTSMQAMLQGMQGMRPALALALDATRSQKLRAEDLGYFDPNDESEHNDSIVSSGRDFYYWDIFV